MNEYKRHKCKECKHFKQIGECEYICTSPFTKWAETQPDYEHRWPDNRACDVFKKED